MNLKNCQRETLDVLRCYFEATQFKSPEAAYAEVANTRDIRLRLGRDYGYANPAGLERVPTVCIKVPTGGGKTNLAAHALKLIAAAQGRDFSLVLWFAPSDAIRRQTAEALKRPTHPYRRELDAAFGGHVRVFDLDERAKVMGLTATPDRNNNTVYAVYAEELFREEMVKLPIELTEHRGSWEGAVAAALAKRRELAEDAAKEAAARGGCHVRFLSRCVDARMTSGASRRIWRGGVCGFRRRWSIAASAVCAISL